MVVTAFRPAQVALVPSLARTPAELTAANVASSTIESLGLFVGPAVGGALLAVTRVRGRPHGNGLRRSVLGVFRLTGNGRGRPNPGPFGGGEAPYGVRGLLDDPLQPVPASPEGLLAGAQTLVAGAFNVLVVVAAFELLDIGEGGVGALNSAVGIGGLLGAVAAALLVGRERISKDFAIGMLLWGIPIALIGIFPNSAAALGLLLLVGIGNTIVDVAGLTLLQRAVSDDVLARVYGAVNSIAIATLGIGAMLAPLLIELMGVRGALVATGMLLPVMTALLFRQLSSLDLGAVVGGRELDLLRANEIFAPLPQAMVEFLGGRSDAAAPGARRRDLPAGRPRRPLLHRERRAEWTSRSTARTHARWAPARASARSRCCATCRERRPSPPRPTSTCSPWSVTTPSRRSRVTPRAASEPTP